MLSVQYNNNDEVKWGLLYKVIPFTYSDGDVAVTSLVAIVIDKDTGKFEQVELDELVYNEVFEMN